MRSAPASSPALNVKTIRQVAKPGSGLATLTQGFTYESAFNKVATATDARGKVTSYTYTAQGLPLAVTSPADAAGVQPVTTFGYTAYTAAGFPAFYQAMGSGLAFCPLQRRIVIDPADPLTTPPAPPSSAARTTSRRSARWPSPARAWPR